MLRVLYGFLVYLFSNAICAHSFNTVNTVGEAVIPGYTPPEARSSDEPSLEEKPTAENRQESRPTDSSISMVSSKPILSSSEQEAWQTYMTSLRSCTPGTYVLKQINPALLTQFGKVETNKIESAESGICIVKTMYYAEDDPRLSPNAGTNAKDEVTKYPSGLDCRLTRANIETIIAMDLDFLAGKKIQPSDTDPFSKGLAEECNAFIMINGEKMMVDPDLQTS